MTQEGLSGSAYALLSEGGRQSFLYVRPAVIHANEHDGPGDSVVWFSIFGSLPPLDQHA
jgi:hypothetical protein